MKRGDILGIMLMPIAILFLAGVNGGKFTLTKLSINLIF